MTAYRSSVQGSDRVSKNTRRQLRPCATEGCGRFARGSGANNRWCGRCWWLQMEAAAVQRIWDILGPSQVTDELLRSWRELLDAQDRYWAVHDRLKQLASEVGIGEAEWTAIRRGDTAA